MKQYIKSSSVQKSPIAEFYADCFNGSQENLRYKSKLMLGGHSTERRALVAVILEMFGYPMFSVQSELKIDEFAHRFSDRFHLIAGQ